MSRVKGKKNYVLGLSEGKMRLTVMALDSSKPCYLQKIPISLECSRYKGGYKGSTAVYAFLLIDFTKLSKCRKEISQCIVTWIGQNQTKSTLTDAGCEVYRRYHTFYTLYNVCAVPWGIS